MLLPCGDQAQAFRRFAGGLLAPVEAESFFPKRHTVSPAGGLHPAIARGNWDIQPLGQLEIDRVIPLQIECRRLFNHIRGGQAGVDGERAQFVLRPGLRSSAAQ